MISCNALSLWAQIVIAFFAECEILMDSDLQIQILYIEE